VFSIFTSIKNAIPEKSIDFPSLIKLIRNNPQKDLINTIRDLRKHDKEYKTRKRELFNITPNCIVTYRSLKTDNEFENNFKQFSQFVYLDIDGVKDVEEYKNYFINKYGNIVSLVSLSASLGGLNILIRVSNTITQSNFKDIRSSIIMTYLMDEIQYIDPNCVDIGRAMYISSDPNVYFNYENEITIVIKNSSIPKINKGVKQPISEGIGSNNRLNDTFYKKIDFKEVMDKICLKTNVFIDKPIVDIIPVDFAEVTFPQILKDNNKHRIYTGMIHSLVYLNPDLDPDYLYSYLCFINNNFANPQMEPLELFRLFKFVYNSIKNDSDYSYSKKRIKWVHFNKRSRLTGDEKRAIASKLNGKRRCNDSIQKIQSAKEYLLSNGLKVTQKIVAELTSLSLATIQRHFKKEQTDLNEQMEIYNTVIPPNTNGIHLNQRFKNYNDRAYDNEYVHPDCPRWVLTYILSGTTA
jgi:hypothetical protein